eukprot:m51a1_g812 hypothetical protein (238) ;mRNA; r:684248-684961
MPVGLDLEALAGKRGFCSWSGGKDSALALCECLRRGLLVDTLVTVVDETGQRSRSHGLRPSVLRAQARLLGMRLVEVRASWSAYESNVVSTFASLARDGGHSFAVFGDIGPSERDRQWEESVCARSGLRAVLPLWGLGARTAAGVFVASGIEALVSVCVPELEGMLGRRLDQSAMDEVESRGLDRCGENGEYHTVVVYAPPMGRGRLRLVRRGVATVAGGKLAVDWCPEGEEADVTN